VDKGGPRKLFGGSKGLDGDGTKGGCQFSQKKRGTIDRTGIWGDEKARLEVNEQTGQQTMGLDSGNWTKGWGKR